jgi:addiction module RelE/StbE family toxin
VRKHPDVAKNLQDALELLAEDAFHPRLRTHKLRGKLQGSWACSVGYDLRIIFSFVRYKESEAIFLETVGTHEEVY